MNEEKETVLPKIDRLRPKLLTVVTETKDGPIHADYVRLSDYLKAIKVIEMSEFELTFLRKEFEKVTIQTQK